MTQTSNRIFDEMARLMNDAAGVAQGVRREFDTLFRSQAERILRELDVVPREEFEAVKEMARLAREENEALKARIEALEAKASAKKSKPASRAARGQPRRWASRYFRRFPCAFSPRRYKPRAKRGPRHPWRLAAFAGGRKAAFFHWLTRGYHYGYRPDDEGDGAPERRQGGRAGSTVFRPGAGSDLRRQQAPDDGPARP